jgi:hypothetical protein
MASVRGVSTFLPGPSTVPTVHTLGAARELVAAAAGIVIEHDAAASCACATTSAEELVTMAHTEHEIDGHLD